MVYSGNRDYHSAYQPTTYPMQSGRSEPPDAENRLPRRILIAVAVVGLASYGVSFGGAEAIGWDIRFAALAALCAGFSLLATQKPQTLATAVLAAMGFLDALSRVLTVQAGWAPVVIVVLNAVQAAAAIAALVLWRKPDAAGTAAAGYEAYLDYYNQAVRQYYTQQAVAPSAPAESSQRGGYGQAWHGAQAAGGAQRAQRSSQPGDYAEFVAPQGDYSYPGSVAGPPDEPSRSGPQPGMPSSGPAQSPAGRTEDRADWSEHPSSPP